VSHLNHRSARGLLRDLGTRNEVSNYGTTPLWVTVWYFNTVGLTSTVSGEPASAAHEKPTVALASWPGGTLVDVFRLPTPFAESKTGSQSRNGEPALASMLKRIGVYAEDVPFLTVTTMVNEVPPGRAPTLVSDGVKLVGELTVTAMPSSY